MHYLIIFKKLCGWGEEILKKSFGKNNSVGPVKGIGPFAPFFFVTKHLNKVLVDEPVTFWLCRRSKSSLKFVNWWYMLYPTMTVDGFYSDAHY